MDQTATSAALSPDPGAGTYSFQAHLRDTSTGQSSAYTAPKSITVS